MDCATAAPAVTPLAEGRIWNIGRAPRNDELSVKEVDVVIVGLGWTGGILSKE
jgi:hypothetical protein